MKKVVFLMVVAALTLSLCSCSVIGIAMGAASAIQQAEAEKTPKGGYTDYWENGIPSTIPEFKYGTYDARMSRKMTDRNGISYMLNYTGVKQQDVDDYAKLLKVAGFDVSTTEGDGTYSIMGMPPDLLPSPPDDSSSPEGSPVPTDYLSGSSVMVDLDTDGRCTVDVDLPPVSK